MSAESASRDAFVGVPIALAHHWLVTYRGGEKVLAEFRRLFPDAAIATLVLRRGEIPDWIIGSQVTTSWLQRVPRSADYYKQLLPLHPSAFGRLQVPTTTRLVLSTDAAMVKGLRLPLGAKQVCYCHSPPRYLWDLTENYLEKSSLVGMVKNAIFRAVVPYAKRFDYHAAQRVDAFIANSRFVAERIRRCYGREATVIYPPVSVEDFSHKRARGEFYLIVSQLTPYKRVDLAVRAFSATGRRLIVIGEGSELAALRKMAGPSITLMGKQPFSVVRDHLENCRAFVHPQIEDFGIAAVEAQAAGRPVIALRAGGALETVIEGETGIFFDKQDVESINESVTRFEAMSPLSSDKCRANAERFNRDRFRAEVRDFLSLRYPDVLAGYSWPLE